MNYICECVKTVSMKAVIRRDGKLLMVLDDHGHWDLPGGRMACKEDVWDTLRRELKEELGLGDFTLNKRPLFVLSWSHPERPLRGIGVGIEVETSETNFVSHDKDIKEIAWVKPEELKNLSIAGLIKPHYLEIFRA